MGYGLFFQYTCSLEPLHISWTFTPIRPIFIMYSVYCLDWIYVTFRRDWYIGFRHMWFHIQGHTGKTLVCSKQIYNPRPMVTNLIYSVLESLIQYNLDWAQTHRSASCNLRAMTSWSFTCVLVGDCRRQRNHVSMSIRWSVTV